MLLGSQPLQSTRIPRLGTCQLHAVNELTVHAFMQDGKRSMTASIRKLLSFAPSKCIAPSAGLIRVRKCCWDICHRGPFGWIIFWKHAHSSIFPLDKSPLHHDDSTAAYSTHIKAEDRTRSNTQPARPRWLVRIGCCGHSGIVVLLVQFWQLGKRLRRSKRVIPRDCPRSQCLQSEELHGQSVRCKVTRDH